MYRIHYNICIELTSLTYNIFHLWEKFFRLRCFRDTFSFFSRLIYRVLTGKNRENTGRTHLGNF